MKLNFELTPAEVTELLEKRWGRNPQRALNFAYNQSIQLLEEDLELDELIPEEEPSASQS